MESVEYLQLEGERKEENTFFQMNLFACTRTCVCTRGINLYLDIVLEPCEYSAEVMPTNTWEETLHMYFHLGSFHLEFVFHLELHSHRICVSPGASFT
jgi:hypothetical protein